MAFTAEQARAEIRRREEIAERERVRAERPGILKRGLKVFGRAFVDTLTAISTKSPLGKDITVFRIMVDDINMAKDAGLIPPEGTLKDFLAIPEEELNELFGGEPELQRFRRKFQEKTAERAAVTPGLQATEVPEAVTLPEKAVDVVANVAGFVSKLALTKKALGPVATGRNLAAWETLNQLEQGTPGKGATMYLALRGIDKIPVKGTRGVLLKTSAQSGLFATGAAVAGGDLEDVATAAILPWALRAVDLAGKQVGRKVRTKLEDRAVKNLREIGKDNGVNMANVPDGALKFIIQRSRQAKFWNKQFDKGKISEETLNARLDQIRQEVAPVLRSIARQQPAKPGDIVKVPTEPTPEAVTPAITPKVTPTPPADIAKPKIPAPVKPLEAKPEAVGELRTIAAEKPATEKVLRQTDDQLLAERREINQIPQKERTPTQIEKITEIENELVERNADEFPDIDITPKNRNAEVRKVTEQITTHGIYQAEIDAAGDVPNLAGSFNVDSTEIGDVKARFEGRPNILKKFNEQETGGPRWDQSAAEIGVETLDEFMDMVELFVESQKTGRGRINEVALANALNSGDLSIELFAMKHEMLKEGFTAAEINTEIQEFAKRENINLELIKPELISLEDLTDVQKKQTILRELDKSFKPVKEKKVTVPEQAAITKARDIAAKTKQPVFVVEKEGKFSITKKEPTKGGFTKITPPAAGEVRGKIERLVGKVKPMIAPEELKEVKKLRQRINIEVKKKGLTQKAFSDLKLKHGGSRRLAGIRPRNIEQLQAILKAILKARPKIIGHRKVISLKTEKNIAKLRENLTDLEFMNDEEFQKILNIEAKGKEAKFVDARNFITQKQANDILLRMHDTAQRLRVTEPIRKAVEKSPEIKTEVEKIAKLPKKAKDPSRLKSMRFFFQRMGEQATQPIYEVFLDLTFEEQARSRVRHKSMKLAEKLPDFAKIANDKEALQRVEDFIVSQSVLEERPKFPKDITPNERRLAKLIQASFEAYETLARAGKFFEFFDNRTEIPQYLKFKKDIDRAFDIYNTKGYDALIKYLDTQDWGVVSAGYSPMESVVRKVSTTRMPDIAIGKGRIRPRSITYRKQDRDILQRWYSYMRQMDQLVHIQPRIKSLVRLVNDSQESFVNPGKINSAVSTYLDNLKHTNYEDGLIEEWSRRFYSQAITVRVLADPVKPLRNLAQNLAFSEDRRDFLDPRNKRLTAEQLEFLETHVQQSSVMMTDWAFVGEDPLLLKNLTRWVQRKTLYPSSDRVNRLISFHAKLNRVTRAFAKDKPLTKQMKDARFSDMQKSEQRTALEILAKDGVNAMAMYVAKVHTDNTHFLYAREQRSPAEQTKLGKIALNLALFRRAALEKALFQLGKTFEKGTGFSAKTRAANVLVTLLGMSALVGMLWKKLTGQNYSPYSYFSFLELNFGGLEVATIEKVEDAYNDMISIASAPNAKEAGKAVDKFITSLTKASDLLIPFYDIGWRATEAYLGTENIDRRLGKIMREAIDKEFESRGLREIDRSLIEKIQFTFARGKPAPEEKKRTRKLKIITK